MLICFDGDRTLWDLTYDYDDCCLDLKAWMFDEFKWTIPIDIIKITLNAHLKYENKKGTSHRSVFPLCIMRTFNSLYWYEKQVNPPIELLAKAFQIGDRIYDNPPKPKEEAFSILKSLEETMPNSPLLLLTVGDRVIQSAKIYSTGFDNSFFETHITSCKDKEFYENIYEEHRYIESVPGHEYIKKYECIMIGDSIKRDINPAIEAGWSAIYIRSNKDDDEELIESDNVYSAKDLFEVLEILQNIGGAIDDSKNR